MQYVNVWTGFGKQRLRFIHPALWGKLRWRKLHMEKSLLMLWFSYVCVIFHNSADTDFHSSENQIIDKFFNTQSTPTTL